MTDTSSLQVAPARNPGSAVHLHNINKSFEVAGGRLQVLRDMTLDAPPGSFVAILGPSGSGKSTTLGVIMGLLDSDSGTMTAPPKSEIAYMFQAARLLPWRTVLENLEIARRARARSRSQPYRQSAMHYLEITGLADYAHYFPGALSGGMQQRTALARALSVEASVMLMDEPFSSLDELTARELRTHLLSLWAEHRTTVLFVTHNAFEAITLATSIVVVTPRPAAVIEQIDVDIPRPRRIDTDAVSQLQMKILSMLGVDNAGALA